MNNKELKEIKKQDNKEFLLGGLIFLVIVITLILIAR